MIVKSTERTTESTAGKRAAERTAVLCKRLPYERRTNSYADSYSENYSYVRRLEGFYMKITKLAGGLS